jgi:hypothetical protein
MSGKGQSTKQTTSVDSSDQNYINAMRNSATTQADQGNQYSGQAAQGYLGAQAAGQQGTNAMTTGNYSQFMNPYQQSVINPMLQQFQQQNQGLMSGVDSNATAQGAFGGSRNGVAEGSALAQNQMNQNQQLGNLEYQGFGAATNQALQQANLGMGASQSLQNLGAQNAMLPGQILAQGQGGPTGSTTTTQASSNPWGALLGLAGTVGGAALGGGAGADIGSQILGSSGMQGAANVAAMSPQELGIQGPQNFGFGAA